MSSLALAPQEIISGFRGRFGARGEPDVYRAPGRVNLIGEHTDYNLGFVFPIALEMACYIAVGHAKHGSLRMYSREFEEDFEIKIADIASASRNEKWSDYVVGVAHELAQLGVEIESSDLYIASEVPVGSGLSSSAALEIAAAVAMLGPRQLPLLEIVQLGHRAETQFVGIPSGIMDQYASVFGREGAAIQIDCRSLEHEYVELPGNVSIIAVNSMVKHELGASAYRERVAECQAAVREIKKIHPEVQSLRDVSLEFFEAIENRLPDVPRRRARHVISENERVMKFASAARARDLRSMGRLFLESHRSMQHDYEVSCEEIDFLVDTATALPGAYGARMTGGGFGGCTVNLVDPADSAAFCDGLSAAYQDRFSKTPLFYDCKPAAGARRITVA